MRRALSLTGTPVSPGIGMGRAVLWLSRDESAPRRSLEPEEIGREIERLRVAAGHAAEEIERTADQVRERLGHEFAGIFHAQAMFLKDAAFLGPIEKRITGESVNAEWAVAATAESLIGKFRDLPDEVLRHRGTDLEDVSRILRKHLSEHPEGPHPAEQLDGEGIVLIADELTPTDAVRIPRERVVAFATERGGRTSHAAILARSFGIPAVVAVPRLLESIAGGDRVIVDGRDGVVWREPSEEILALFRERSEEERRREISLKQASVGEATRTRDGEPVAVRANIELPTEADDVIEYGADGVGLLRSEFIYLSSEHVELPSEERQTRLYREVLEKLAPRPVVIRTYDLGGKKGARQLIGSEEANPVLGLRGVRLCLKRPAMFRTQLLALLHAADGGDLRILVPMVSGVEEIRSVRALLDEARDELLDRGVPVPDHVPLGAMIEVPSAAITADLVAPEVDFLALGTNDLVQYTLAVDRANETVSDLFRPWHPAILRLVAGVVAAAAAAKKPLSVCGEMAADPSMFLLLFGLGVREFSMGARSVPQLKALARHITVREAARLARAALSLGTPDEVAALLAQDPLVRRGSEPGEKLAEATA